MNDEMKSGNLFGMSSPILFCLCSIVFAIIGIITFRDYGDGSWLCSTNWFWWRLLWFEAIFALFWFAIFGPPFSRLIQDRRMIGATHAIVAAICLRASLVSLGVWSISSFVPTDSSFALLPVAIQLLIAVYYGVVSFMFPKTQALQTDGMKRPSQEALPSPIELSNKLERLERNLRSIDDFTTVKLLKERIRYSLPSVGRIANCDEYRKLVVSVIQITENPTLNITQACRSAEEQVRQIVEVCKQ